MVTIETEKSNDKLDQNEVLFKIGSHGVVFEMRFYQLGQSKNTNLISRSFDLLDLSNLEATAELMQRGDYALMIGILCCNRANNF